MIRFILCFLTLTSLFAAEQEQAPCKEGNFALPVSQEPGPLIGLGGVLIGKNTAAFYLYADRFQGKHEYFIDVIPGLIYGIRDDLALYFNVPIAASFKDGNSHSAGFEDLFVEMEYLFWEKEDACNSHGASLIFDVAVPTGSTRKNPTTGLGAVSFLLGGTYSYMSSTWFCFNTYAARLPLSNHGTRFGNQYLYQFGVGRLIAQFNDWLFDWMVEIDGTFSEKNTLHHKKDPDSGGNIIFATPSLWVSSKKMIFQLGVGFPIQQNFFGHQNREHFLVAATVGYTF